jgi:hypothetical protein
MPDRRINPKSPVVPGSAVDQGAAEAADGAISPQLVAKAVLPVARPVVPSQSVVSSGPLISPPNPAEAIRVAAGIRPRRKRGLAGPWLGWVLIAVFLLPSIGGFAAWLLFRDEPWLTFQPAPQPAGVPERPGVTPSRNPPNRPRPATPPAPPEEELPAATAGSNGLSQAAADQTIDQPPPRLAADLPGNNEEGKAPAEPAVLPEWDKADLPAIPAVVLDPPAADESTPVASSTDQPGIEAEHGPAAYADPARKLVVVRQLELGVIAVAAGRTEMAAQCLQAARQWAAGDPSYAPGLTVLERLLEYRSTIYKTVASRLPLLEKVGEIPIDKTYASVISAAGNQVVLRFEGQRRDFPLEALPWSVVAGILQVTSSDDPQADQAQRGLVVLLRNGFLAGEAVAQAMFELNTLLEAGWASAEFSREGLQQVVELARVNGSVPVYINLASDADREPLLEDWMEIFLETRAQVKADASWQAKLREADLSRYELEVVAWQQLESVEPPAVIRQLFLIHQLGLGSGDLSFLLDNLSVLDRNLALSEEHVMWADMGRALLASRPADARILEELTRLQTAVDTETPAYSASATSGLKRLGQQLAQRLSQSTERRRWQKVFTD